MSDGRQGIAAAMVVTSAGRRFLVSGTDGSQLKLKGASWSTWTPSSRWIS
jgi:hypothetical protein